MGCKIILVLSFILNTLASFSDVPVQRSLEKLLQVLEISARLDGRRAKQTGGIVCDTFQTTKTHRSISVNQQSRLSPT